jgi:hypothetical protein
MGKNYRKLGLTASFFYFVHGISVNTCQNAKVLTHHSPSEHL